MGIGKRAIRSTFFVTVNSYAAFGFGTISSIIMARLLLPEHFGLIALANFFLSLFGRVKEFGLDYALIHRQDELEKAFKTHFTLQIGLSVVNLLLVIIATPLLLKFYSSEVVLILLVLALFTILKSASSTPRIYLEKELSFGRTTMVDIVSLVLSALLGIGAALLGFGVWSLVVLNVSGIIFTFLGLVYVAGWKMRFSSDRGMMAWFLKFGIYLWVGGVTTFIIFQYNDFILGTFISAAVLGFYAKAYQFAQLPTTLVTGIVSRVALPTYSKLQTEKEKLGIAYNLVLRNIFRLSAPFSLLLFLTSSDLTLVLLGEKWLPMVPLLQLLLIFSLLRPIFDDTGAFLTAIGKPAMLTRYLSVQAGLLLVLTPLLVYFFKEQGAALSLNLVMLVGVLLAYFYANKFVSINYRQIFLPTTLAVLLTTVFYFGLLNFLNLNSLAMVVGLIVKVLIILVSYTFFALMLEKDSLKEDIGLFKEIVRGSNA